jgi:hypothetical protein
MRGTAAIVPNRQLCVRAFCRECCFCTLRCQAAFSFRGSYLFNYVVGLLLLIILFQCVSIFRRIVSLYPILGTIPLSAALSVRYSFPVLCLLALLCQHVTLFYFVVRLVLHFRYELLCRLRSRRMTHNVAAAWRRRGFHKGSGGRCTCKFAQMFLRAYTPACVKPLVKRWHLFFVE